MKIKLSCTNKVVACSVALLALAWATDLIAQSAKQGTAKVTVVNGSARYTADNKTWQPVKIGTVIKPGSVIQTAKDSYVDIVLGERDGGAPEPIVRHMTYAPGAGEQGNVVRITPNSILAIDKLTTEETGADVVSEIQLDLRAGRIMGNVKKLSAASRYEVKFPTGVAGIRGTIYTLDASGVVRVLVGSVIISYLNKDGVVMTHVVVGGQQFDPATGLVTSIPDFNQKEMVKEFKGMGGRPNVPPTSYTVDNTIIYISPTIGFNGNSGVSPSVGFNGNSGN